MVTADPPTSGRLLYETLTRQGVTAFHRLASDEHIARFLLDGEQVPPSWAEEELRASDALFRDVGLGLWLVRPRGWEKPIGFAGFRVFPELGHVPQLLYALLEPYTGRGYATEMARYLVELAQRRGLERITSAADEPNSASRRVLEKVGFVEAGRVPGAFGCIILFEHRRIESAAFSGCSRTLEIAHTWDGRPVPERERASVRLDFAATEVDVTVEAPFHGDPPPERAPGPCPRLWEHEVVELFLLGDENRYLEVELGPHGHYLVLALRGCRNIVTPLPQGMPIFYEAARGHGRWRGRARVPRLWLPRRLSRCNAFAISGAHDGRRHLAWRPVPGPDPDFHRLEHFAPILPPAR